MKRRILGWIGNASKRHAYKVLYRRGNRYRVQGQFGQFWVDIETLERERYRWLKSKPAYAPQIGVN